ncbi:MDR-family, ABC transporter, putative [Theileria annulata]|uniref:MDR-family, ABC transporter, putative n=1 Tax=Theileria annulata TaxID=5874 RepID=Q4UF89_THEAN|nr:MDR-family, ABC transporter, putative [Theileria annulata]CAI74250.1 MDR-family, ABC transporter, putative [Theileria annulata]|eukprot:XP_951982.1 MDR-family, ABC transporter, putative [Theileria annulata]
MGQCVLGHGRNRQSSHQPITVDILENKATKADILKLVKPLFWPEKTDLTSRPHIFLRFLIVLSLFSLFIGKSLSILAPMYVGWTLDQLVLRNTRETITNMFLYFLLLFSSICFDELRNFTYRYVQFICINDLSLKLYEHVHSLNYHWFTTSRAGQIVRSIYRGCESMRELSQFGIITLVPTILESIVIIIVFFTVYKNIFLGMILFFGLTIYFTLTILVTNWRMKTREAQNDKDNDMHSIANDSVNNFESVKLFTNEKFELTKYAKAVGMYELFNYKVLNSLSLINVGQDLVVQTTTFLCLLMGILQILKDKTKIGTFTVILTYLFRIFKPLYILGTVYSTIIKGIVGIQDAANLLKIESTVQDSPDCVELDLNTEHDPIIEFRNVTFSYVTDNCPMDNLILKKVSFSLCKNRSLAIVGPTGTGKTTIFRLLCRLYDPLMGEVMVNGRSVKEYSQRSLRSKLGVVSQDTILFHDSIRNNVRYAKPDATDDEIFDALKKAEFYDRVMQFPDKLDTLVGDRGIKLSGGEKQRVSIARCFLKNPPIIILDEATSSLDSKTESQIQNTINSLVNKKTTITIAHRLSTIINADTILVLYKGEIIEQGRHQELLKLNGFYKSLWDVQRKKQSEIFDQDNKSAGNSQEKDEIVLLKAEESVEGQKSDENTKETSKSVYEGNSEKENFKLDPSFIDKRDSFNRYFNKRHLEIVKLLVKYGANVYSPAKNGMTCLHFAAQKGHLEVLKFVRF